MDPLVTGAELNDYLQRTVPPAKAALALEGASGIVRAYCGWDISRAEQVTFTVDGSGTTVLGLPTLHVTAVIAVAVNGVPLEEGTYSWSQRGQLYRDTAWSRWSQVGAEVDSGYTDIPDVVRIVALSIASRLLDNPSGLKAATVGAVSRTFAAPNLNTVELALLDRFRLP